MLTSPSNWVPITLQLSVDERIWQFMHVYAAIMILCYVDSFCPSLCIGNNYGTVLELHVAHFCISTRVRTRVLTVFYLNKSTRM